MNIIDEESGWTGHLDIACRSFRLGMEATGSESLMRFIDTIGTALKKLPPDAVAKLGGVLNESLSAQTRRDFSYLADMLEYEIRPLLEAAGKQIERTDG